MQEWAVFSVSFDTVSKILPNPDEYNVFLLNLGFISFQAIRADVLDHRPPDDSSVESKSSAAAAAAVAAATLNIDEILELCADYERQINEEQVEGQTLQRSAKRWGPRLRVLASWSWPPLAAGASSRNLGPTF